MKIPWTGKGDLHILNHYLRMLSRREPASDKPTHVYVTMVRETILDYYSEIILYVRHQRRRETGKVPGKINRSSWWVYTKGARS
jgi:hypothetical protein